MLQIDSRNIKIFSQFCFIKCSRCFIKINLLRYITNFYSIVLTCKIYINKGIIRMRRFLHKVFLTVNKHPFTIWIINFKKIHFFTIGIFKNRIFSVSTGASSCTYICRKIAIFCRACSLYRTTFNNNFRTAFAVVSAAYACSRCSACCGNDTVNNSDTFYTIFITAAYTCSFFSACCINNAVFNDYFFTITFSAYTRCSFSYCSNICIFNNNIICAVIPARSYSCSS